MILLLSTSDTDLLSARACGAAWHPANPNRVIVEKAKAQQVWNALENDLAIPKAATQGTATGEAKGVVE